MSAPRPWERYRQKHQWAKARDVRESCLEYAAPLVKALKAQASALADIAREVSETLPAEAAECEFQQIQIDKVLAAYEADAKEKP